MKAVILTYHRIGTSKGDDCAVASQDFERQMNFVAASGYRVIDMAVLVSALGSRDPLAGKVAVITFDDGFAETCDTVCGTLTAHRFPATFFLIGALMGQTSTWLSGNHRLIDWQGARRLIQQGFTIGSHSLTHRHLTQLTPDEARDEIAGSKRVLEDGLSVEVPFFAYPYGSWNAALRDLVSDVGYAGACTTYSGFNDLEADRFALRRLDISGEYSLSTFKRSLTFGENQMPLRREIGYYSRRLLSALRSTGAKHGS